MAANSPISFHTTISIFLSNLSAPSSFSPISAGLAVDSNNSGHYIPSNTGPICCGGSIAWVLSRLLLVRCLFSASRPPRRNRWLAPTLAPSFLVGCVDAPILRKQLPLTDGLRNIMRVVTRKIQHPSRDVLPTFCIFRVGDQNGMERRKGAHDRSPRRGSGGL